MARTVRRYTNEEKSQAWRLRKQGLSENQIGVWMGVSARIVARWFSQPKPILPHVKPPPKWTDEALCTQTDPEVFFPEQPRRNVAIEHRHPYSSAAEAKAICHRCPIKDECLQWALDNDELYGVWGGTTARERKRLKRLWKTK